MSFANITILNREVNDLEIWDEFYEKNAHSITLNLDHVTFLNSLVSFGGINNDKKFAIVHLLNGESLIVVEKSYNDLLNCFAQINQISGVIH